MSCGNVTEASGVPRNELGPPIARFRSRKNGALKTHWPPAGSDAGVTGVIGRAVDIPTTEFGDH
jgi:hypothetical protein